MKNFRLLLYLIFTFHIFYANAQKPLPEITVRNYGGKIVVSWLNDYPRPASNILIQRSYDSLKNYTTIGSVLNPQSRDNGYSDANPPYTRMYYRVSVSFEGGSYIITSPKRPIKDITTATGDQNLDDNLYSGQVNPGDSSENKNETGYPSQRIFTSRDNNLVIHLADAAQKKYSVKFFDEADSFLFELNKLTDEYLILEKVNFRHNGWFLFEIYESGNLVEKNKFQISRDLKANR